jgi:SAM-dependent methyltransferase
LPSVLHLGCGRVKHSRALGIDTTADSAADLVWDLDQTPWPLPDSAFDKVYLINVLEHLEDVVRTMEEVHRVGRPGAHVIILAPFASSHHLWTDPTHKRGFMSRSFQYFTEAFAETNFAYTTARFRQLEVIYDRHEPWGDDEKWLWQYRPKWWDRQILRWINHHKMRYEMRFMYWYQLRNIYSRLEVVK